MELIFPIEFLVSGTPVSFQSARPSSKSQWKQKVRAASDGSLPENHFACEGKLAVTLFYFPVGSVQGDVDNIVKLVLDALDQHIYIDDSQIERGVIQKFEPQRMFSFTQPSPVLEAVMNHSQVEQPV